MNKTALLEIKKVNFNFGQNQVLRNISLEVQAGDFLALVGPNGSGKTTLLKTILGLHKPNSGTIRICGQNIKKFSNWNKLGYVPQKATHFEANFPASVREVVSMGLISAKKFPKIITKTDQDKIEQALQTVQMLPYKNRRISALSGGQQQRVLIARAIVANPQILFLDEPTTGIDQNAQQSFYDLLEQLNQSGITIILVSHDMGRITKYVTKVASLNQTLKFYGSHPDFCAWDKEHNKGQSEHKLCLH